MMLLNFKLKYLVSYSTGHFHIWKGTIKAELYIQLCKKRKFTKDSVQYCDNLNTSMIQQLVSFDPFFFILLYNVAVSYGLDFDWVVAACWIFCFSQNKLIHPPKCLTAGKRCLCWYVVFRFCQTVNYSQTCLLQFNLWKGQSSRSLVVLLDITLQS